MTTTLTIPTEIAAAHDLPTEITLAQFGALIGLTDAEMAQAQAQADAERVAEMRAKREAKEAASRAAEAKVAAIPVGQIVKTEFGYYVLESHSVATTWWEVGGDYYTERQVVTLSKCRKNGQLVRNPNHLHFTVNASEFGHWF